MMNEKINFDLKILIVSSEPTVVKEIEKYTASHDQMEFTACISLREASSLLATNHYDISLIDYKAQEKERLQLVNVLKKKSPKSHYLIMAAEHELEEVLETIPVGISGFILKPFKIKKFDRIIKRMLNEQKSNDPARFSNETLQDCNDRDPLIGQSNEIFAIRKKISLFAQSDAPVLITGETGVGKEIVARIIHASSSRLRYPLIAVNCSAFAETLLESELFGHVKGAFTGAYRQRAGRLELAKNSSILLDEICEIPPQIQVKLLRVLQEKEFERVGESKAIKLQARIISATNRNIEIEIQHRRFREDLFYRLNTLHIHIPPLRERKSDIEHIAIYFLKKFSLACNKKIASFDDNIKQIFHNHPWPGNVRQLENVINFAVLSCDKDKISEEHLPESIVEKSISFEPQDQDKVLQESSVSGERENIMTMISNLEQEKIKICLEKHRWNKTKTAASLGLTRAQLLYRLQKYAIT